MSKSESKQTTSFKRYIIGFWSIILLLLFGAGLFVFLIMQGAFGELPSTKKLENPDNPLASELYTDDGKILGKYYSQNRVRVEYEEINDNVINALIATEDVRFHNHSGIDLRATAAIPYYLLLGEQRGSSTITQQLAKNLFPRQRFDNVFHMAVTKLKEWIIAIRLERNYTKQEILTMYLNTVDFGQNSFGIQSAARTYFSKSPSELNEIEAATLIGLLKGTHYYSPVHNPENSLQRRNTVLYQMNRYGFLDEERYNELLDKETPLRIERTGHAEGMANHFREHLRGYLMNWARENNFNIYTDGLRIHTTIDSRMQEYAERSMMEHLENLQHDFFNHWEGRGDPWGEHDEVVDLSVQRSDRYRQLRSRGYSEEEIKEVFEEPVEMEVFTFDGPRDTVMTPLDSVKYHKHFLRSGMMAMEPESGKIRAWVSGPDYRYFKYDHVNKRAKRQVGSTFKPFVYAMAIMNGYSPCFEVPNVREVYEDYGGWSPENYDGQYGGMKTLKDGLSESINTVSAQMISRIGPENVISLARQAGIESHIPPLPSIALGSSDISLFEMVGAFNSFTNNGMYTEPVFIDRIEDRHGNVIEEFVPRTREVMDPVHNYIMVDMLRDVVDEGTGRRLRFTYDLDNEIAGKTGTTQRNSDGWFLGMVPELTAGVWTGGEHRAIRFRDTRLGQGANTALPTYGKFMQKVYEDPSLDITQDTTFQKPAEELPIEIDCERYEEGDEPEEEESMPEF